MGVKGLNKEINNNVLPIDGKWILDRQVYRNLSTNKKVKKNENGTLNLIIDAFAYFYYLSGMINWFVYDNIDLLNLMKKHIHYLLSIKDLKNLIFVFDGVNPPFKRETEKERRQNRISSMDKFFREITGGGWSNQVNKPETLSPSPLVQMTFIQFLVDISKIYTNIQTKFCIFEADAYIAELSIRNEGYVISNDSDFYIYNTHGYININSLEFPMSTNYENFVIKYKMYTRNKILNHFSLTDDTLPIFATLCGNDYLKIASYEKLKDFLKYYSRYNSVRQSTQSISYFIYKNIVNFVLDMKSSLYGLNRFPSEGITPLQASIIERICERIPQENDSRLNRNFRDILINSVQQYNNNNNNININNINGINGIDFEIGNDILNSYESGNYYHRLLNVSVKNQFECSYYLEDYSKEPSWNITSNIRKSMYGLIKSRNQSINKSNCRIEEVSRDGAILRFDWVEPTFDYSYNNSSVERNFEQYLKIFDSNTTIVKELPYYLIPVVASLRYLLKDKITKKLFVYAEGDNTYQHLPNASNYSVSSSKTKLNYYELEALIASSIAALTFTYLNNFSPYLEDTQEFLAHRLSSLSLNATTNSSSSSSSTTNISSSNLTIENNIQKNDQGIHQILPYNNIYTAMNFNGNENGRSLILNNNKSLEKLQNNSYNFKNAIHIYAEFINTLIMNSYVLQVLKLTENLASFSSFYSMYCYVWEGAYYNMIEHFRNNTNNKERISFIFRNLFNVEDIENSNEFIRKLHKIYLKMLKAIVRNI